MKKFTMTAIAASVAVMAMGASAPASAQGFAFSFNTGDVAFAYNDGYWDHAHRWHSWRSAREAREYRRMYGDHYYAYRHTHFHNGGWRDDDHDGVPNAIDRHPENPYRP